MNKMTAKQFLMCKLNERFVVSDYPDFSDEFILELLGELELDDLIEIMDEYAQEYSNSTGRKMEE